MKRTILAMLVTAAGAAHAQSATLFGTLANFDVVNDLGHDACGFEIELDGISASNAVYLFGNPSYNRYGAPTVTPFPGGVYVRYQSAYDPVSQQFTSCTPPAIPTIAPTGHVCWAGAMGLAAYLASGCEHFGVSLNATPANQASYWLIPDPANPGALMRNSAAAASIPIPSWIIVPPPVNQPANPPQVEVQVPPPPPKPEQLFGDAQWVKIYKTELPREVGLDELQNDNPAVVPEDPAQVETGWTILQFNPQRKNNGAVHSGGPVGSGSRAVVRRWEFYKYSGVYDPLTHEALCADGVCNAPADGELGDFVGSQMGAANVGVPSITVQRAGSGTVTGASGKINCGGSCTTTTAQGAAISLTASPSSSYAFTGWSGACDGASPTCSLVVNDQLTATATFTQVFGLSIGRGGSGTVAGSPQGALGTAINCGSSCSAKFLAGQQVVLTATPAAGWHFVNWTGACSGTDPTCALWINANASAQANFSNK